MTTILYDYFGDNILSHPTLPPPHCSGMYVHSYAIYRWCMYLIPSSSTAWCRCGFPHLWLRRIKYLLLSQSRSIPPLLSLKVYLRIQINEQSVFCCVQQLAIIYNSSGFMSSVTLYPNENGRLTMTLCVGTMKRVLVRNFRVEVIIKYLDHYISMMFTVI